MGALFQRFKEPSSWAGLTGLLILLGMSPPSDVIQAATQVAAGICGLLAFFFSEKK